MTSFSDSALFLQFSQHKEGFTDVHVHMYVIEGKLVQPSVSEGKLVQPSVSEGNLVQPGTSEGKLD